MLGLLAAALASPSADIPAIPTDRGSLEVHSAQSPAPAAPSPEPPAAASPAPASPAPESPAPESDVLEFSVPWWERITVTVDDKGKHQTCRYEASVSSSGAEACDAQMAASMKASSGTGRSGLFSKLTFERRFSPGGRLDSGRLQPGDTLLGRQVMFLTIDAEGSITSCKVVAASGDARPDYGCEEVRKEQFRTQPSADPAARQAFMTVLAYGHLESLA